MSAIDHDIVAQAAPTSSSGGDLGAAAARGPEPTGMAAPGASSERRRRGILLTTLAIVGLWAALTMPGEYAAWGMQDFVRLPLAGLAFVGIALVLPRRVSRVVAIVFGVALGVLVLLRGLDIGFRTVLSRPFDVVDDWSYLGNGVEVIASLAGPVPAVLAAVGAVLVAVVVLVGVPMAAVRVAGVVARRHAVAVPALAALVAVWVALALTGVGWPHGYYTAAAASTAMGRMAVQVADEVPRGLNDRALAGAGFAARSEWADSPTFGAGSWLAHSSVEAGLWVNSQRRYDQLLGGDRLTLSSAFGAAGWRTVFDVPSTDRPWPQGRPFYRYDPLLTALVVGYRGARYGYATMPDQYIYASFDRHVLTPGHAPVFAEIDTLSSHYPWTEPPALGPWGAVGDGAQFTGPTAGAGGPKAVYARTIAYAMDALTQFVVAAHDPNLVVLAVGDHQPNGTVTAPGASHQVPFMLISRDAAVLAGASGWGWGAGLAPARDAPVWAMSTVRDRVFTTFGTDAARVAMEGDRG